jgi:hypothetical protein
LISFFFWASLHTATDPQLPLSPFHPSTCPSSAKPVAVCLQIHFLCFSSTLEAIRFQALWLSETIVSQKVSSWVSQQGHCGEMGWAEQGKAKQLSALLFLHGKASMAESASLP